MVLSEKPRNIFGFSLTILTKWLSSNKNFVNLIVSKPPIAQKIPLIFLLVNASFKSLALHSGCSSKNLIPFKELGIKIGLKPNFLICKINKSNSHLKISSPNKPLDKLTIAILSPFWRKKGFINSFFINLWFPNFFYYWQILIFCQ